MMSQGVNIVFMECHRWCHRVSFRILQSPINAFTECHCWCHGKLPSMSHSVIKHITKKVSESYQCCHKGSYGESSLMSWSVIYGDWFLSLMWQSLTHDENKCHNWCGEVPSTMSRSLEHWWHGVPSKILRNFSTAFMQNKIIMSYLTKREFRTYTHRLLRSCHGREPATRRDARPRKI